jgi:hypothetical protein
MPERLRRRPAAAVGTTVAIATLVALAVAGAGYGAQRLLLRTPPQSELVAARAVAELPRFRYNRAVVTIAGGTTRRAECLEGWEVIPGRKHQVVGRGAEVIFSDGERLRVGAHRVVVVRPGNDRSLLPPVAELELAGCGHVLANYINAKLTGEHRVYAVATTWNGQRVYRFHLRTKRTHFDVYVSREKLRALAVHLETRYTTAHSRIEQVRLTPALKQSFLRRFAGG